MSFALFEFDTNNNEIRNKIKFNFLFCLLFIVPCESSSETTIVEYWDWEEKLAVDVTVLLFTKVSEFPWFSSSSSSDFKKKKSIQG